jgi:hypothetical protein
MLLMSIRKNCVIANKIAITNASTLKNISRTLEQYNQQDSFINNLDIVYQELAHHLEHIAKAIKVAPRNTFEHNLWRLAGGIIDAKDTNPFVLEQLRRSIKLDEEFRKHTDAFLWRAQKTLERIAGLDQDGILEAAFSEGLMGQTITILSAARQMAMTAASEND